MRTHPRLGVLLMLGGLLVPITASATHIPLVLADRAGADLVLVQSGDVVSEDLYAAANRVVVEGTVEGDVLAVATGQLQISGHVLGNVTGVASSVTIDGTVDGSVRVAAARVQVGGHVGGDLLATASRVTVTGQISRDLLAWSLGLDTTGTVGRDVGGQTFGLARIGGTVDGDVDLTTGRLQVLDGAKIGGTLGYRSSTQAVIGQGVQVGRQIVHKEPVRPNVRVEAIIALTEIIGVIAVIVLGFLLFWAAPLALERSVAALRRFPIRTFFVGVAALVLPLAVIAVASGLAFATSAELVLPLAVVGGPIALTVLGLILVGLLLAPIPVLTAVGGKLLRWRRSGQAGFLVGSILWLVVLLIPVVGSVVVVIMALSGLGAWTMAMVTGGRGTRGSFVPEELSVDRVEEIDQPELFPLPPE